MRKVVAFLGNFLLVASILVLLALSLTPTQIGFSLHSIISGSMEPALNTGGLIALKTIPPEKVNLEDIICFNEADSAIPICHRVIDKEITETGFNFRTKGDALEEADNWIVSSENLLGIVVYHLPFLGLLAKNIRTPLGFFITIVIPAIIIIILEIINYLKPTRARVQRAAELRKNMLSPANSFAQISIALLGLLWLTIAGNTQSRPLNSFPVQETKNGIYSSVHSRTIRNDGYFPLIICMTSSDKDIIFENNSFLLSSGEEKKIKINNGQDHSIIITRGFLPTLPSNMLYQLFQWNLLLSPLISIAIPIGPILIIGWFLLGGNNSKREEHRARAKQMEGRLI